jgi:hypothetical protein
MMLHYTKSERQVSAHRPRLRPLVAFKPGSRLTPTEGICLASVARLSTEAQSERMRRVEQGGPAGRATAYRGCGTPREQALMEGLLKPSNCVTRAPLYGKFGPPLVLQNPCGHDSGMRQ